MGRILSEKKIWGVGDGGGTGLLSEKTKALNAELNQRAEVATSSYSAEVDFLQYIYLLLVAKNH